MADTSYYGNGSASASAAPEAKPAMEQGKIFVGGLSWQTTEESLRWHFEQYGPVVSVDVMKDRTTGQPRGFAFVTFEDGTTVDLVMAAGKHEINHKIVDVKRAQARGLAPPSIHERQQAAVAAAAAAQQQSAYGPASTTAQASGNGDGGGGGGGDGGGGGNSEQQPTPEQMGNKVFVGGIPPNVDRDGLQEIFEQFGRVVDAIVMVDQMTMRSRCFGFVTFEQGSNGAAAALAAQPLPVQGRSVEVKLATPRPADQDKRGHGSTGGPPSGATHSATIAGHLGLRAGKSSTMHAHPEYAGLAVAYGRSGWKAGYGSRAFGRSGWAVQAWEDTVVGPAPLEKRAGFSFDLLLRKSPGQSSSSGGGAHDEPASKRSRH